jgi:thiamine biosynthesis lipoprotein
VSALTFTMSERRREPRRSGHAGRESRGGSTLVDESFRALGTTVRVYADAPDAAARVAAARALVEDYDRRLSRFRADSELCALNADPRERVPASDLLRDAVAAGLWAAERSGGLVDPTLLAALEAAGYGSSLEPSAMAIVPEGEPAPATADPGARWRAIRVEGHDVVRPPGLRLDLGGSGKGHVADLVAATLTGARLWCIDCGGDLRVGGDVAQEVVVAHPFGGEAARLTVANGAVATSAVHARAWRGGHHLIDPATGRPAWTGVLQATATASTALEAETLAKMALLGGPARAGEIAWVHVLADGETIARGETS